jgi:hypothetical protein
MQSKIVLRLHHTTDINSLKLPTTQYNFSIKKNIPLRDTLIGTMRHIIVILFCLVFTSAFAQDEAPMRPTAPVNERPPIDYYKIISAQRDTTYVDTTLNIQKNYKFNYLRRDNFELMPFANVGQTYNALAVNFNATNLKPLFVAQSHHYNYNEINDIDYYNVPTPWTRLYFKTAFEQGQQLDSFFTVNTSEQFNFSLQYKGVRSLGNYQQSLTSTGNFTFTTNYYTKNNRYRIKAHLSAQDILNRENGGLNENSLQLFIADDSEFSDRGRLDVNFEDAENKLEGLRFYGQHEYDLIKKNDSTSVNSLTIENSIWYEDKFFEYRQINPYTPYGESYKASGLLTTTKREDFNVNAGVRYENDVLGKMGAFAQYTNFNFGYNSVIVLNDSRIPNRIKGDILQAGGSYEKEYRGFALKGKAAINVAGDFDGNYIQASAGYALDDNNKASVGINIHSVAPNFNFLLYQNDYVNYNWKTELNNVKTQELRFDLQSKKIANVSVSYTGIDDFAYFGITSNDSTPTPQQFGTRVDYLKIKAEREINWRMFALMNTVMYQNVVSGAEVFNVPQLITRQSLYYKGEWFKKALNLEMGVGFKYFTKYNMNAYDPVLAEFYVQNEQELGGFPLVDIFFNAKIKQTRIFFTWEHFNQLFSTTNEYFSAPGYPFRDAAIRFGLVWDFFL